MRRNPSRSHWIRQCKLIRWYIFFVPKFEMLFVVRHKQRNVKNLANRLSVWNSNRLNYIFEAIWNSLDIIQCLWRRKPTNKNIFSQFLCEEILIRVEVLWVRLQVERTKRRRKRENLHRERKKCWLWNKAFFFLSKQKKISDKNCNFNGWRHTMPVAHCSCNSIKLTTIQKCYSMDTSWFSLDSSSSLLRQ